MLDRVDFRAILHGGGVAIGALLAYWFGKRIVLYEDVMIVALPVVLMLCVYASLRRPIVALYILAIMVFVIPSHQYFLNIRLLSPPLMFAAAGLLGAAGRRAQLKQKWMIPLPVLLLGVLLVFHVLYAALGIGERAKLELIDYVQNIIPLLLFLLAMKSRQEARRVIYAWVLADAIYNGLFIADFVRVQNISSLAQLMEIERTGNLTNLVEINVVSWQTSLVLPFILNAAIVEKRPGLLPLWLLAALVTCVAAIFTFGRVGLFSVLLSLLLTVAFNLGNRRGLRLWLMIIVLTLAGWTLVSNMRMLSGRIGLVGEELPYRMALIQQGLETWARHPLFGAGPSRSNPPTHSYFVKVAMQFGTFYFLIVVALFGMMLRNSWRLLRSPLSDEERAIFRSIAIMVIVAIPQTVFGITLEIAWYAMFFWLCLGAQLYYLNIEPDYDKLAVGDRQLRTEELHA